MQKTVYFIEGDGIGPEVMAVSRPILDAALKKAYNGEHSFEWKELLAGEKAEKESGTRLPEETMKTLAGAELAIKGPLGTPVGKGFRSLNVTLRQTLDLYACIRPIRHFAGVISPLKHPEKVDMVVFRENTEDIYLGIEYKAQSPEAKKLITFLKDEFGAVIDDASAIGIKPMSARKSKRLVRKAVEYALAQGRDCVTLVHKGNIMKYTEGGFREWGYELAAEEFGSRSITEEAARNTPGHGKLIIRDRIADAMFQEIILRPELYNIIATPNLNGDYISDALAAQVGGLGMAPGVNMSDSLAFFEATHGTAPNLVGQDKANPCSVLLSGALMLEHVGWNKAADRIYNAVNKVLASGRVTGDLAGEMENATVIGCRAFGDLLGEAL